MRLRVKWMRAPTPSYNLNCQCHRLAVCWPPGLSKQSYSTGTRICLSIPLPRARVNPVFISLDRLFPHQLLQGEEGWVQETFQAENSAWNPCFVSSRKDEYSAFLAFQQQIPKNGDPENFWLYIEVCGKHQRGFSKTREATKEQLPPLLILLSSLKSCSTFP